MDSIELLKLLGQSGVAVLALLVLGRIVYRVGERMVVAIDAIRVAVQEHTKIDLEHHGKVAVAIERLDSRIDGILEERERSDTFARVEADDEPTPLEKPSRLTRPRGVPTTYSKRGGTHDR
jgi:hypothetical protein